MLSFCPNHIYNKVFLSLLFLSIGYRLQFFQNNEGHVFADKIKEKCLKSQKIDAKTNLLFLLIRKLKKRKITIKINKQVKGK